MSSPAAISEAAPFVLLQVVDKNRDVLVKFDKEYRKYQPGGWHADIDLAEQPSMAGWQSMTAAAAAGAAVRKLHNSPQLYADQVSKSCQTSAPAWNSC